MKSELSFGVHYILRHPNHQTGKSQVYARITVNCDRTEMALKCYVKKSDWNGYVGIAKAKNDELKELNNYLEDVRKKFREHYKAMTQCGFRKERYFVA